LVFKGLVLKVVYERSEKVLTLFCACLAVVTTTNYRIVYRPEKERPVGMSGFTVYLNPRFVSFCKKQEFDTSIYNSIGQEMMKAAGFSDVVVQHYPRSCNFEGGFLTNITVPGNACGLDYMTHGPDSPMLAPHNVDNDTQMKALLGIFSHWAQNMEYKIMITQPDLSSIAMHAARLEEILDKVGTFILSQHPIGEQRKSLTDWINELYDRKRDGPVQGLFTYAREYLGLGYPGKDQES